MGNWSMHIEGHGIHDNGKDEDADTMLRKFVDSLAVAGQSVHSATITVGFRARTRCHRAHRLRRVAFRVPLPAMTEPVVTTYDEYLRIYQPETWWASLLATNPGRAGEIAGECAVKDALAVVIDRMAAMANGNGAH